MIIKVDHISYSGNRVDKKQIIEKFENYKVDFEEVNLKNVKGKQSLFNEFHDTHDLVLLKKENSIPIELTLYEGCKNNKSMLEIKDQIILVRSKCRSETEIFFECLGFKEDHGYLYLKTILDNVAIKIRILESNNYSCKLDNNGYSSLAFWVNNIEKERKRLIKCGYETTPVETLKVNEKILRLCFVIGTQGEVIELIGVNKNENN